MGKRSNFTRVERDYYPTPKAAVEPLIDHLPMGVFSYAEPCAGDGRLIRHIHELTEGHASCTFASDIEPRNPDIIQAEALSLYFEDPPMYCITNPPWDRKILHPLIEQFALQMPTWLLFDADWMHTKQSARYMHMCKKVVSIGRVKWIEDSKSVGKDNCCWYLFDRLNTEETRFYGRLM